MLGYIFKIDKIIVIELTSFTNSLKYSYKSFFTNYDNKFSTYFNQSDQIDTLKKQLEENKKYKVLYKIEKQKINECEKNLLTSKDVNLQYVEVLSYLHINDFSKVLLDTKIDIGNKILALSTIDGYSAGIVMQENNQIVAYLNNNKRANYAVFIGENKIPGITSGMYHNNIKIKYIPKWNKIDVGDIVKTSGMDNIFPAGLEVGIVQKVEDDTNTQTAYIKPSIDILNKKYFYIIDKK